MLVINNNHANLNLVNVSKDEKSLTIKFRCLSNKTNTCFSVKIEPGDIDGTYTLEQLIDLLHEAKVVICKREGGWKSANYSANDAHERQKSISELFNSYIMPKITLCKSVFCNSSYFNKQMTFKNLIKLRDKIKSQELAQSGIYKVESKTLVDKNNLSNLFQHSNKFKDKDKINQQSSENSPTSSLIEKNEYQKKDLVDKDINSVLKLKLVTVPSNKNIKKGCFAMEENSKSDKGQGYIFKGGNSFYIKFDDLLATIKKILNIEDANKLKSINIRYGAHLCESLFGQRGSNRIYFDSDDGGRFKSLLGVDINNEKNKLLCFKTFIGGKNFSQCEKNSCANFYRVGFKLNVNIGNDSNTICFASFPDGNESGNFSSVSLYRVNDFGDKSACDKNNKILIYQNKDVTKGAVEVKGETISECPNLEIIDSNGIELESIVAVDSDVNNNNNQDMGEQDQNSENADELDELNAGSLKISIWCSQELNDGFTLEIKPDDINVESPSPQLEQLINALGKYPVNKKGLLESLSQLLVSAGILGNMSPDVSCSCLYNCDNWDSKSLRQKFKELVSKGSNDIYVYGAKLSNKEKYGGRTITLKEIFASQTFMKQIQTANVQQEDEKIQDIEQKGNNMLLGDEKQLQEQHEDEEEQNYKQTKNVNNMLFDKTNKNVDPNSDVAQDILQSQLQILQSQEKGENGETQYTQQTENVNNMLFDKTNKNVDPNSDAAQDSDVAQDILQPQLQILQSQEKGENGETQYTQQNEKKHGKPSVFLIFIKDNRRKIAISIFSVVGGIVIGFIIGWIFAPILPVIGSALIFLDLKFNFLEQDEVSKNLNTIFNPEETDPQKIKLCNKEHTTTGQLRQKTHNSNELNSKSHTNTLFQ